MRQHVADTRPCESCGRKTGSLWIPYAKVIDTGFPGVPPIEPNMMEPRRCDDCELLVRLADPAYVALYGPTADRDAAAAIARGAVPPKKSPESS